MHKLVFFNSSVSLLSPFTFLVVVIFAQPALNCSCSENRGGKCLAFSFAFARQPHCAIFVAVFHREAVGIV